MRRFYPLSLLLLCLMTTMMLGAKLPVCWDVPLNTAPTTLPLCGNGVLDAGEVCDDGNQVAGDGCDAFCSAFDAMPAVGTLAGGTAFCPYGRPVVGGMLSNTFFCNLRAVEVSPDGAYAVLADGGTLLRYELFTDATTGTITPLAASIDQPMVAIGSMAILAPDSALLVHDCATNKFFLSAADGAHVQTVADLSSILLPIGMLKNFYDRAARTVVTAGVLQDNATSCIGVYGLSISMDALVPAARTLLATIPCTVYGVIEGGTRWSSMDMRGMLPHLILRDRCPPTFRSGQWCYVVYMQRPSHLEQMRAYLPEEGGLDLQFYASTLNLFDNALGAPLIRQSQQRVYTLRGACFQMESRVLTADGKTPPTVTLANTCKRVPQQGLACATPLNNAFITDATVSPILLPAGLSANHTHAELSAIFNASCDALSNVSVAGPLLYQLVLASVYGNTTPVDFVELPNTLDILFVSPTSVGLISTKRILFFDRAQPGYVRPTNLIYCPAGRFGFVGSVCNDCKDRSAPGYYVSISWQIQCPKTTSAGGITSPPYETFTMVGNLAASQDVVHSSVCDFTESRNVTCPSSVTQTPPQVYNLDADLSASPSQSSAGDDLVQCLIRSAERALQTVLFRSQRPEFMSRIVATGSAILTAAPLRTSNLFACGNVAARGLSSFLTCAIATSARASGGGRRLLQSSSSEPMHIGHHDVAVASTTYVTYAQTLPSDGSAVPGAQHNASSTAPAGASSDAFPMALAVGLSVGCVAIIIVIACILMAGRRARTAQTLARFVVLQHRR